MMHYRLVRFRNDITPLNPHTPIEGGGRDFQSASDKEALAYAEGFVTAADSYAIYNLDRAYTPAPGGNPMYANPDLGLIRTAIGYSPEWQAAMDAAFARMESAAVEEFKLRGGRLR